MGQYDEERYAALFCNDFDCCPRDWNLEHPMDQIEWHEWNAEQDRLMKLFGNTKKSKRKRTASP